MAMKDKDSNSERDKNEVAVSEQSDIGTKLNENIVDPSDYGFGIDDNQLEKIMGRYKERGTDFRDLKYFEEQRGIDRLLL